MPVPALKAPRAFVLRAKVLPAQAPKAEVFAGQALRARVRQEPVLKAAAFAEHCPAYRERVLKVAPKVFRRVGEKPVFSAFFRRRQC